MKPPYALILLIAATTAYGQINNPISSLNDLTVRSLTTSEPVTWVLDAMQTNSAPPTSSTLTLPDNANVIRLTNNNTGGGFNYSIQRIANGRLGAFYYLVNQSDYPITINNTNGITVQGGTSLTLGANQAATLVATGATNASVAARGDLNDVTLGGTANTAPSQTASSGSSLMTRDLVDNRSLNYAINSFPNLRFSSITAAGGTVIDTPWNTGAYTAATTNAIAHGRLMFPLDSIQFGTVTSPNKFWLFTRVSLFFNTNNSLDTVTFGDAGGTNTVQYPLEEGTSTNPAYVSYGANSANDDNRFAIQLRHNSTNIQARLISMRPGSPSGVYSETAWTNVAVSPILSTLAERPLLIALQRNNTNVIAYAAQATGIAQAYIDANSLQVIGSATITEGGYNPPLGFRAVSKSGNLMRVEFMNTQAVVTP